MLYVLCTLTLTLVFFSSSSSSSSFSSAASIPLLREAQARSLDSEVSEAYSRYEPDAIDDDDDNHDVDVLRLQFRPSWRVLMNFYADRPSIYKPPSYMIQDSHSGYASQLHSHSDPDPEATLFDCEEVGDDDDDNDGDDDEMDNGDDDVRELRLERGSSSSGANLNLRAEVIDTSTRATGGVVRSGTRRQHWHRGTWRRGRAHP